MSSRTAPKPYYWKEDWQWDQWAHRTPPEYGDLCSPTEKCHRYYTGYPWIGIEMRDGWWHYLCLLCPGNSKTNRPVELNAIHAASYTLVNRSACDTWTDGWTAPSPKDLGIEWRDPPAVPRGHPDFPGEECTQAGQDAVEKVPGCDHGDDLRLRCEHCALRKRQQEETQTRKTIDQPLTVRLLACNHACNDLREDCEHCQQEYNRQEEVIANSVRGQAGTSRPATTPDRQPQATVKRNPTQDVRKRDAAVVGPSLPQQKGEPSKAGPQYRQPAHPPPVQAPVKQRHPQELLIRNSCQDDLDQYYKAQVGLFQKDHYSVYGVSPADAENWDDYVEMVRKTTARTTAMQVFLSFDTNESVLIVRYGPPWIIKVPERLGNWAISRSHPQVDCIVEAQAIKAKPGEIHLRWHQTREDTLSKVEELPQLEGMPVDHFRLDIAADWVNVCRVQNAFGSFATPTPAGAHGKFLPLFRPCLPSATCTLLRSCR